MGKYQRMISYIYQYQHGIKEKNVGYVRIELRNEKCRLTVFLQEMQAEQSRIFLFRQLTSGIRKYEIGQIKQQGNGFWFQIEGKIEEFLETGHSFLEMDGLLLLSEKDIYYATVWNDVSFFLGKEGLSLPQIDSMSKSEKKNPSGMNMPEQQDKQKFVNLPKGEMDFEGGSKEEQEGKTRPVLEKQSKSQNSKQVEEQSESQNSKQAEEKSESQNSKQAEEKSESQNSKQVEEKSESQNSKQAEEKSESQNSKQAEEQPQIETMVQTQRQTHTEPWDLNQIESQIEILKSKKEGQEEADELEAQGCSSEEFYAKDSSMKEENIEKESIENETINKETIENGSVDYGRKKEAGINETDNKEKKISFAQMPERGWQKKDSRENKRRIPDHEKGKKILEMYPNMYPFEIETMAECVKMDLKDIGSFPVRFWSLAGNPFLLHSYYCYRHILFAQKKDGAYCVGAPGIYSPENDERARQCGFVEFIPLAHVAELFGAFGYWLFPMLL